MVEIRQPNITATDQQSALLQMRSYLYQLSQQLNWAFSTMETGTANVDSTTLEAAIRKSASEIGRPVNKSPEETFNSIKGLIIKSAEIVDAYSELLEQKLSGSYVAKSEFGDYKQQTQQTITANSNSITQAFTDIQTITGNIANTNTKIDDAVSGIQDDIQAVADDVSNTNTRIDGVETDIQVVADGVTSTNTRIDGVETDIQAVADGVTNTNTRIDGVADNIQSVANDVQSVAGDVADANNRIDDAASNIHNVSDSVVNTNTRIDNLEFLISETNAWIRTGLLGNDSSGAPVYGVEVGQKTTTSGQITMKKFARFTAGKLSFYDANDTEVAYISDYKLFITSARILSKLELMGQFEVACDGVSMDFKWVGG